MKFYYADPMTAEFLKANSEKVYLYGGFVGYNNFGDIIQLKHAIDFYKKTNKYTPVVILHLSSLEDAHHIGRFEKWYQNKHLVFLSDSYVDTSDSGLQLVEEVKPAQLLHVYGGGFLNKYWGRGIIEKVADILQQLNVENYVFAGQQVEKGTAKTLEDTLFSVKKPLLFGVRDKDSLNIMKETSIKDRVRFSFDDVTEIFNEWRKRSVQSPKQRFVQKLRAKEVLFHINISSYATANKLKVLEKLRRVKRDKPRYNMIVAHAYNDIRISLKDSLQSVIQLENDFPYSSYKVMNLADYALAIHPETNSYPNIGYLLGNVKLSVTSSYHTAMLTTVFGIPSFLMSENEFYSQKRKALGFGGDFGEFMKEPIANLNNFSTERAQRATWLTELRRCVLSIETNGKQKTIAVNYNKLPSEPPKLQYRSPNS